MKVTNVQKLPESLYQVLSADRYERKGDYSVTDLINPPQIVQLTRRYWDELAEDASDRIWMLVGESVHAIISWHDNPNALKEERLFMKLPDGEVSGMPDLLEGTKLTDYKVTSVWTVVDGNVRPDWEKQLNCYAVLYRANGFDVSEAQVIAILRDWSKGKAKRENGYPQSQVKVIAVDVWQHEEARMYMEKRLKLHKGSESLEDQGLPECSFEDRWGRPTTFAVMKDKAKRATRVLDSLPEAEMYIERNKLGNEYFVEERPGGFARCEGYCAVSHICPQLARENGEGGK